MSVEKFKKECSRQLTNYFQLLQKNKVDAELIQRIQGFINVGEFLGIIPRVEAVQLMDDAYLSVFKMTIEQRNIRTAEIKSVKIDSDNNIFDIPAIQRMFK